MIVIVNHDEVIQPQMAAERAGFRGDALLQTAVAGDDVDFVINDRESVPVEIRGKVFLRQRHPDRIGDPLTEWTGRDLHARGVTVFRVPRRLGSPLSE
jgi:hypothetical protein